jgi:hypothetical protein
MITVRIGPIDYEIVYVPDLQDGGKGLDGWFRFDDARIEIKSSLSIQARRQVLWHEIIHGIFMMVGGMPGTERQEDFIDALAYAIMDTLRNNPWLGDNDR